LWINRFLLLRKVRQSKADCQTHLSLTGQPSWTLPNRDLTPTDWQIRLAWDRNVVEPGKHFFPGCSTIAAASSNAL
jgi:hypothetical protein